eukprot:c15568_g1_i2.p1 GENE.c15568_g1_i2~~c15568_g1_i2.p1  ORF type:complete len:193 (+),score=16.70 c15568_g1_i2:42-620(+)
MAGRWPTRVWAILSVVMFVCYTNYGAHNNVFDVVGTHGISSVPPSVRYNFRDEAANPCRNTGIGLDLVTDNHGRTCHPSDLTQDECCNPNLPFSNKPIERTSTSLHSCQTCDPATSCCESFPYCVACCMSEPQRLSLANSVPDRVVHLYASLHSVFDVCQIVCRTNSRSVVFETTFKQPKTRHCYQYPNSVK